MKQETEEKFKSYKGIIYLKHSGIELICDVLALDEKQGSIHIKNPCSLQSIMTEEGKSQMAMIPFLMTSKEDSIHISLSNVLFINECRLDIEEQHTQMHSSIALPKKHTSQFAI
jgi:hypothetical protein